MSLRSAWSMAKNRFGYGTTAEQAANALRSNIAGKNVLVSGVTWGGLGAEAARVIAKHANLVVLGGRSMSKLETTMEQIKRESPNANLRPLILDLSSFAGARRAAAKVNAYPEPIHVLLNSAAIMAVPYAPSTDNPAVESHMATNHFAPFLFTSLIFPRLLASSPTASDPARVVNISSDLHRRSPIRFEDLNFGDGKSYSGITAYGQSKTANVLFANEIARRSKEKGLNVVAYSMHPGVISGTNLWGSVSGPRGSSPVVNPGVATGASTYVVAAFDPSLVSHSGAYLEDGAIAESRRASHAKSVEDGARLWALSEEITEQKFDI